MQKILGLRVEMLANANRSREIVAIHFKTQTQIWEKLEEVETKFAMNTTRSESKIN